jgi:hypothetical protein
MVVHARAEDGWCVRNLYLALRWKRVNMAFSGIILSAVSQMIAYIFSAGAFRKR